MKTSPLQPNQRPAPTVHGFKISNLKLKYVFRTFSLMIYKCTKLWVTTKISSFAFVFITYIYKACQVFNGSLKAMPERNLCLQGKLPRSAHLEKKKKKRAHGQLVPLPSTKAAQACILEPIAKNSHVYIHNTHTCKKQKKNRSRI